MRNTILLIFTLLSCLVSKAEKKGESGNAQPLPFKYEVRVGYGGAPVTDIGRYSSGHDYGIFFMIPDLDRLYQPYHGDTYVTGNISAEFDFIFKKWFTLSLGLFSDCIWRDTYDGVTNLKKGRDVGVTMFFLPQARFTYVNRPKVTVYSSVGLGAGFTSLDARPVFALQTVPVGVSFGRRIFGFAEFCLGSVTLGLNAGVGYRF